MKKPVKCFILQQLLEEQNLKVVEKGLLHIHGSAMLQNILPEEQI